MSGNNNNHNNPHGVFAPREQSMDADSTYDDTFKDVDDLTSVGDHHPQLFEEDWDDILGSPRMSLQGRNHASSTASNPFIEPLDSDTDGEVDAEGDGSFDPFTALDDGTYAEYASQNTSNLEDSHCHNDPDSDVGIRQKNMEYTNGTELSGYDAGDDNLLADDAPDAEESYDDNEEAEDEEEQEERPDSDHVDDADSTEDYDDEELSQPPPPPTSPPPPTDDEFDDNDTVLTTDDDESVNLGKKEEISQIHHRDDGSGYEDAIYHAGYDRDGLPVLVFLPSEALRLVEAHVTGGYGDLAQEEERLLNYCTEFVGKFAMKSNYVLVVATADSMGKLVGARDMLRRIMNLIQTFPRLPHKKSLKKLIILHPDQILSAVLLAMKPFISGKFWRKLMFVRRVADLDTLLEPNSAGEDASLPLPEDVLYYDITGAVGMDVSSRHSTTQGRQARVRAESEVPSPPSNFSAHWTVAACFGIPLGTLSARTPFNLPAFVIRCVTYLCLHGVKTPGIFRVSGNEDTIRYDKKLLERGKDIDLGGYWSPSGRPATVEDIYVCASLLKTFVRELPKPILTHAALMSMIKAGESISDNEQLAAELGQICALLPRANRNLLQYLSYFMRFVLQNEPFNQMTAQNLAIVWAPNIFRTENDNDDPRFHMNVLNKSIRPTMIMFTHPQLVFPLDNTTLLPICYNQESGELRPVDEVCVRDATAPKATQSTPFPLEEREFDELFQRKQLSRAAFSLSAIVDDGEEGMNLNQSTCSSVTSTNAEPQTLSEINALSVKDLKRFLIMHGYDPTSCIEKADLRRMAIDCLKAIRLKEGLPIDDLNEAPARPPSGSMSTTSHGRLFRRRSSEGTFSLDGSSGSKRGSDLRLDRRESDVTFRNVLRQAGMPVDDSASSVNDDNSSVASGSKGDLFAGSSGGGQKRDFSQVGAAPAAGTKSRPRPLSISMMRRRNTLTHDKKDVSRSAAGLLGRRLSVSSFSSSPKGANVPFSTGVDSDTDSHYGDGSTMKPRTSGLMPDKSEKIDKLLIKRGSSFTGFKSPSLLEETLRALKETPLFGEDDTDIGGRDRASSQATGSPMLSRVFRGSPGSPLGRKSLTANPRWQLQDVDTMEPFDLKTLLRVHRKEFKEDTPVDELRNMARSVLKSHVQ